MGQKVKFNSGPSVIPQLAMSTSKTMNMNIENIFVSIVTIKNIEF